MSAESCLAKERDAQGVKRGGAPTFTGSAHLNHMRNYCAIIGYMFAHNFASEAT